MIPSEGWRVQFVVDHHVFIQVVTCHVRVLVCWCVGVKLSGSFTIVVIGDQGAGFRLGRVA